MISISTDCTTEQDTQFNVEDDVFVKVSQSDVNIRQSFAMSFKSKLDSTN